MTTEQFVSGINIAVSQSAVQSTIKVLENPPGRKPAQEDVELSTWYNSLTPEDKSMVMRALAKSARLATFGFLCVLDGVRVIENQPGPKGDFELYFIKDGHRTLINERDGTDPLHDIFNLEGLR